MSATDGKNRGRRGIRWWENDKKSNAMQVIISRDVADVLTYCGEARRERSAELGWEGV
jgi:hypothetical protein